MPIFGLFTGFFGPFVLPPDRYRLLTFLYFVRNRMRAPNGGNLESVLCTIRTAIRFLTSTSGKTLMSSLGGERSILLSYRDIYSIFGLFPGFLELQPVLRRLRRAVLLIKKRSIFDRFISSIRIIDPSAIVRREAGTVASGAISQDDLNSQQICPFSADSCSPFFLGGARSIH